MLITITCNVYRINENSVYEHACKEKLSTTYDINFFPKLSLSRTLNWIEITKITSNARNKSVRLPEIFENINNKIRQKVAIELYILMHNVPNNLEYKSMIVERKLN